MMNTIRKQKNLLIGLLLGIIFLTVVPQPVSCADPALYYPGSSSPITFPMVPGRLMIFTLKNADAPVSMHITQTAPPDSYSPIKSKLNVTNAQIWFLTFDEGVYYLVIENPHSEVVEAEVDYRHISPAGLFIGSGIILVLLGVGIYFSIHYMNRRKTRLKE